MQTNFLFSKICWQSPAMLCLYKANFPTNNLNFHWRWWDCSCRWKDSMKRNYRGVTFNLQILMQCNAKKSLVKICSKRPTILFKGADFWFWSPFLTFDDFFLNWYRRLVPLINVIIYQICNIQIYLVTSLKVWNLQTNFGRKRPIFTQFWPKQIHRKIWRR